MPTRDGKLTGSDVANVRAYIEENVRNACPICGERDWDVHTSVVAPIVVGSSTIVGPETVPQIMVISRCGYVMYFAAKAAGIEF